jgi:hypothetical protein
MEIDIIANIKVPTGLRLVPVGRCHLDELANTMRSADVAELRDCFSVTPREALESSCKNPGWAVSLLDTKGRVICIGGMSISTIDDGDEIGVPWLLASDLVEANKWGFLELSRQLVAEMRRTHPTLFNYCDARNTAAHRWLKWLGFTLCEFELSEGQNQAIIPFIIQPEET